MEEEVMEEEEVMKEVREVMEEIGGRAEWEEMGMCAMHWE